MGARLITTTNIFGDGITCHGPDHPYKDTDGMPNTYVSGDSPVVIRDTVVDFSLLSLEEQDGGIDCAENAHVVIENCVIRNVGKGMLVTGGRVSMLDCIIECCGRRCPEVQDGGILVMDRCYIWNWGSPFTVRSFGAWAHNGGRIIARNCHFRQDRFSFRNFWRDLIGHVGQAFNDRSRRLRDYLMPGQCRGLTAGPGGYVEAINCTKNKWWIQIENMRCE